MWTEEMTRVIRDQFVAVAVSGHVAMNRKDAEGDFLRQTGIKLAGAGGNLECLTASGIRLGTFYAAGGTEHNRRDLANILKKWQALPEAERKPGAVRVPEPGPVADNVRQLAPPDGGLILRTYHRLLTREPDDTLRKAGPGDYPLLSKLVGQERLQNGDGTSEAKRSRPRFEQDTWVTHYGERWEAQPDFMWIKEAEWKAIVRPEAKVGDRYPLVEPVADRLTRAHLIMGMAYGECGVSDRKAVRSRTLDLTVTAVSADRVGLRLAGAVALGADYETSVREDRKGSKDGRSVQGFEPKVLGYLTFDRKAGVFTRFDVVALGDAYGTPGGDHHFNYRAGRYPIGIWLELADGTKPADRVPPRAAVVYDTPNPEYFGRGK